MILSHRIALDPTERQREYFARAAGCARFVWNWALEAWNRAYRAGEKPNGNRLRKTFNQIKYIQYPWMRDLHRDCHSRPFDDLQKAFSAFFGKRSAYPTFHKKRRKESFYIANDQFVVGERNVRLPRIGVIRMREKLRFSGKIMSATVSRFATRWFITIRVEVENASRKRTGSGIAGADWGLKNALTITRDGAVEAEAIEPPKPLAIALKKLRRMQRSVSRRKKGGRNRERLVLKVASVYARTATIRKNFWDQITTRLCRENQAVGIEDLSISGMLKNRALSRSVKDVGYHEFRRQMEYKSKLYGTHLIIADQWYPSSKTCSRCGAVKESLSLSERVFRCDQCGHAQDRDVNASRNLCHAAKEALYPRLEGNLRSRREGAVRPLDEARTGYVSTGEQIEHPVTLASSTE